VREWGRAGVGVGFVVIKRILSSQKMLQCLTASPVSALPPTIKRSAKRGDSQTETARGNGGRERKIRFSSLFSVLCQMRNCAMKVKQIKFSSGTKLKRPHSENSITYYSLVQSGGSQILADR